MPTRSGPHRWSDAGRSMTTDRSVTWLYPPPMPQWLKDAYAFYVLNGYWPDADDDD